MTPKRGAPDQPWRVGECPTCRVAFAGRRGESVSVGHLLRVHARICPGGNRLGEVVMPLEAVRGTSAAASG